MTDFTRRSRSEVLAAKVLDLVQRNPGVTLPDLVAMTQSMPTAVIGALRALRRQGVAEQSIAQEGDIGRVVRWRAAGVPPPEGTAPALAGEGTVHPLFQASRGAWCLYHANRGRKGLLCENCADEAECDLKRAERLPLRPDADDEGPLL